MSAVDGVSYDVSLTSSGPTPGWWLVLVGSAVFAQRLTSILLATLTS